MRVVFEAVAGGAPVTGEIEAVDHDAAGLPIIGKTIRMRINGGDWFYGVEAMFATMTEMMAEPRNRKA